jgi:hypothetical protein
MGMPRETPESMVEHVAAVGRVCPEAAALTHLARAAELGYDDARWLRSALAFRSLHGNPRFEAVVREVEKLDL